MSIRRRRFSGNWLSPASIIVFAATVMVTVSRAGVEISPGKEAASAQAAKSANTPIRIVVDATEAPRKILHARLSIPASAGPLTLMYPKWIPGEHGPTGPITDLAGLKISAAGKTIPWRRDDVEMFAFHIDVVPSTVAEKAGLGPGMKLTAVNGSRYSLQVMHEAVRIAKSSTVPIELLVENGEMVRSCKLDYHDGERFPHLERDPSKPDLLEMIIHPLTR